MSYSVVGKRIVVAGGGNGGPKITEGLMPYPIFPISLANMFDNGGSSEILRKMGIRPPGDYRRQVAVHHQGKDDTWPSLMAYRFPAIAPRPAVLRGDNLLRLICTRVWEDEGEQRFQSLLTEVSNVLAEVLGFVFPPDFTLGGHPGGNLLYYICEKIWGSYDGPQRFNQLLNIRGEVWPISVDDAHLVARLDDGTTLVGENLIDGRSIWDDRVVVWVMLDPEPAPYIPALQSIHRADLFVWPAGDTQTSIRPIRCVPGVIKTLRDSQTLVVACTNLMTKSAETPGWRASDFITKGLFEYGREREQLDAVFVNVGEIPPDIRTYYKKTERAEPVIFDEREERKLLQVAKRVIVGDYINQKALSRLHVRHDPHAIAGDVITFLAHEKHERLLWIVDIDDTMWLVNRGDENSPASVLRGTVAPGAREFLHTHGYRTYALTAGKYNVQVAKGELLRLSDYGARLIIVERQEDKKEKIQQVIEAFDIRPELVVVVGDRLDSEIAAGNELGCTTVRVCIPGTLRYHDVPGPGQKPAFTVESLHELTELPLEVREYA